MNTTASSTSLSQEGEMLLSGATADREKEPWGWKGQAFVHGSGWGLAPWCTEGPSGSAGPTGQRGKDAYPPPTVSNLLLSDTVVVTPWLEASYLEDDK